MCGIAGYLGFDGAPPVAEPGRVLGQMADMLAHRGPDSRGAWHDGPVGFGHTRLSVIDLSAAADQPMQDASGSLHIVFNGEIYNYRELRLELAAHGAAFRTRSDTEVILEGWRTWGEDVFDRLRGMFALALWDGRDRRLVLARDPVGKKPLFVARHGRALLFGSECKAILAWPGFPRRPDLNAIHHYLTLQYVPGPMTAFEGIARLAPGEVMTVAADGTTRSRDFRAIPGPARTRGGALPRAALVETIREGMTRAVRRRLVADVPVGAFLSGGVDSTAIVAAMVREGRQVQTFSMAFPGTEYDEGPAARSVAERLGTDHHELAFDPDVSDVIPSLAWQFDQPFADSSAVAVWCLAEFARRHVKVALSGDGGDELFLGYTRYADLWRHRAVERLPHAARRAAGWAAEALPPAAERWRPSRVGRRLLAALDVRDSRRYAVPMAYFRDLHKRAGYGPALAPFAAASVLDLWQGYFGAADGAVAGAAWSDLCSYLPDDLLVKLDMATMAHGLESRCPLLDIDLVRAVAGLPVEDRMPGGVLKGLMKEALADLVPADIRHRPKMGFALPLEHWLPGPLEPLLADTILTDRFAARGLFRPEYVARLVAEHRARRLYHHPRLWALLMLELWYRTWIDPPEVAHPRSAAPMDVVRPAGP